MVLSVLIGCNGLVGFKYLCGTSPRKVERLLVCWAVDTSSDCTGAYAIQFNHGIDHGIPKIIVRSKKSTRSAQVCDLDLLAVYYENDRDMAGCIYTISIPLPPDPTTSLKLEITKLFCFLFLLLSSPNGMPNPERTRHQPPSRYHNERLYSSFIFHLRNAFLIVKGNKSKETLGFPQRGAEAIFP